MKFCPSCGAQLPDEAKFCPSCGAKQPVLDNTNAPVQEQEQPQVVYNPNPTPVNQTVPTQSTDERAEYERLMTTDPKFAAFMKASTMKSLGQLVNLLFVIVAIVYFSVNYLIFTGIDLDGSGKAFLDVLSGGTYPFAANKALVYEIYEYSNALGKAFSPSSSMDASITSTYIILLILTIAMVPVTVLVCLLNGLRKGYRLKAYLKDGGETSYKELKTKQNWLIGTMLSVVFMVTSVTQYIGWKDLNYSDGHYLFGVITSDPSNMVACLVVGSICIVTIIAVSIVFQVLAVKMTKPYFEQQP